MTVYGFIYPSFKPISTEVTVYPSEMSPPPDVQEAEPQAPTPTATMTSESYKESRRMAFEAWNRLKDPDDPPADTLAEITQLRITMFAREIRNQVIEQLAGSVKRYYDRTTNIAVDSLMGLKE